MRKVLFITLIITIALTSVEAAVADWKFYGSATLFKGEETIVFYDSESVEYISGGTIRVWVKAIGQSEFDMMMEKNEKQILDKSAEKVASGYFPPYSLVNQKTNLDDSIEIISWEELANSFEINSRAKLLFEIDCIEKKIRTLSVINYKDDRMMEPNKKKGDWNYISPESNAKTLQEILCKQ